jgi:hypothetical protein
VKNGGAAATRNQWRLTRSEREERGIEPVMASGGVNFLALCRALQISPLKNEGGFFPEEEEIRNCIHQDGLQHLFGADHGARKLLVFLYGRDFKKSDPQNQFIETITRVLQPSGDPGELYSPDDFRRGEPLNARPREICPEQLRVFSRPREVLGY